MKVLIDYFKRLANKKTIERLLSKRRGLEWRLDSLKSELNRAEGVLFDWKKQVKNVIASDYEKQASVDYYQKDVDVLKKEILDLEYDISLIEVSLHSLGVDVRKFYK